LIILGEIHKVDISKLRLETLKKQWSISGVSKGSIASIGTKLAEIDTIESLLFESRARSRLGVYKIRLGITTDRRIRPWHNNLLNYCQIVP
jgi:hypothetical protein